MVTLLTAQVQYSMERSPLFSRVLASLNDPGVQLYPGGETAASRLGDDVMIAVIRSVLRVMIISHKQPDSINVVLRSSRLNVRGDSGLPIVEYKWRRIIGCLTLPYRYKLNL